MPITVVCTFNSIFIIIQVYSDLKHRCNFCASIYPRLDSSCAAAKML